MEGLKEQALRRERQGGRLRRGADYTGRMSFEARKNVPGREWGSVRGRRPVALLNAFTPSELKNGGGRFELSRKLEVPLRTAPKRIREVTLSNMK